MDDLDVKGLPSEPAVLPVRPVRPGGSEKSVSGGRGRRTVPPFDGGRLRRWTRECIASPSGYLYTRISDWPSSPVQSADGDRMEIMIADIPAGAVAEPSGLDGWLAAAVQEQQLAVEQVDAIDRLVFEDSTVVGVVFDTPDGSWAVRARHGVLVCGPPGPEIPAGTGGPAKVALVGRSASRFGRVEMLTDD